MTEASSAKGKRCGSADKPSCVTGGELLQEPAALWESVAEKGMSNIC